MGTGKNSATRRRVLQGLGAAAVAPAAVSGGAATGAPRAARAAGSRVLSAGDRHLVGRFSYGVTPELTREVLAAGGARRWFAAQLDPDSIAERADWQSWWPGLSFGPAEMWLRNITDVEPGYRLMFNYQRSLLRRRIETKRQVLEVMTEFWENHLNVPVNGDSVFTWRRQYGDVVRSNALGRFADLLKAAITHPAMLIYLDAYVSTAEHPNENLGRELLELHTVGRGNYDEGDVKDSARILTGWSVDRKTWAALYRRDTHAVGPVSVMGFSAGNSSSDGRQLTMDYLDYLAHHPETAQRLARKLATKFVSDNPSTELVSELARVYLDHDTAIVPVLQALVASGEFRRSAGAKVRDPCEDVVATYRALQIRLTEPPQGERGDVFGANAILWQTQALGQMPLSWPRPDGQPIDNDSWASPSRLVASMSTHYALSGGWWPREGTTYRSAAQWLPKPRVRFDELVDHLSVQILARRSTDRMLKACCEATGLAPGSIITAAHPLVRYTFRRLLTTFLDSPDHLTR